MTPFMLTTLLHYYVSPEPPEWERRELPIWPETLQEMLFEGLLKERPEQTAEASRYVLTARGRAFCDSLQRVPLPQERWVTYWPEDGFVGVPKS